MVNISTLIFLDSLFSPVYRAASWVFPYFFSNQDKSSKLVVIKFFGMGSIVRMASVLKNTNSPISQIELITLSKNRKIAELLDVKTHCIRSNHPLFVIYDLASVMFRVWNMKQARIVDMERTSNLSGTFRLLLSLGKSCSSFSFDEENQIRRNQRFVTLKNKPAIQAIAEMFEVKRMPSSQSKERTNGDTIIVNVNAGEYLPQRKYPIQYFAAIIQQLQQKNTAFKFVLTGLQKEVDYTSQLAKLLDERGISYRNTAGKLSLKGLIEELKQCTMLITNDSGPLHLARYFDVPTVAIWGPTSAKLVGYPDSTTMINIASDMMCSPCFIHPKSKVAKACSNRIDCLHGLNKNRIAEAAFMLSQSLNLAANAK